MRLIFLGAGVMAICALGACKKSSAGLSEASVKQLVASAVETRSVPEEDAQKALAALNMSEAGGKLSWGEKTGSAGNYVFTDLKTENGGYDISRLEVTGLRMLDDDTPFADKFKLTGLSGTDSSDGTKISIAEMSVILPDEDDAGLLRLFTNPDADDFSEFQKLGDPGNGSFTGGGYIEGLEMDGADADLTLAFAGLTPEVDGRSSLLVKNLSGTGGTGSETAKFSVDSLSIRDMRFAGTQKRSNAFSPFSAGFSNMLLDNLKLDGDGLNFSIPKMTASHTETGAGLFVSEIDMPLANVVFTGESTDPELAKMKTTLGDIGYDSLEFTLSSKAKLDENKDIVETENLTLTLKDGFIVSGRSKIEGMKHLSETMAKLTTDMQNIEDPANMPDPTSLLKDAYSNLVLHGIKLSFEDRSIIDKAIQKNALDQDVSPDLIRQQAKAAIMMVTLGAKGSAQTELAGDFAEKAQGLIDLGGTLTVEMSPEGGFKAGQALMDYQDWQQAQFAAIMTPPEDGEEIIAPEPFDMDGLIESIGISFSHSPDPKKAAAARKQSD